MRTEASRLRREVLDLGRALIAIHDQAEVLWTRIQDLAPPAAGWWVSAFKLLDPDSPEAKVSSEETTTLAVLTQRPFPNFSELPGRCTSRHRDAVDVAVRALLVRDCGFRAGNVDPMTGRKIGVRRESRRREDNECVPVWCESLRQGSPAAE